MSKAEEVCENFVQRVKYFRVIFVEASGDICRERLLNRRYNIVTGSKHILSTANYAVNDDCKLGVHPRDFRLIVERDVRTRLLLRLKLFFYRRIYDFNC